MKIRKSDFTGMSKVFKFSLSQSFKSKSSIVMLIIMFLTSAGTLVISALNSGAGSLKETQLNTLYIVNDTQYSVGTDEVKNASKLYSGLNVQNSAGPIEAVREKLDKEAFNAAAEITRNKDAGNYNIAVYTGKGSKLSSLETSTLSSALTSAFSEARLRAVDATDKQLKTMMSSYSAEVKSADEYMNKQLEVSTSAAFGLSFVYTFLLFMLIMYSTAYIIRSIIDEKTSSLVETLMVSIKPLALIIGKILAAMCLMIANLAVLAIGMGVSYLVMSMIPPSVIDIKAAIATMGIGSALSNLNWYTSLIMLASILLGYATFSIIGGITGTCCSSIDDAGSANALTLMLCYFGYFGSLVTMALHGKTASIVVSLVPILSVFSAPIRFTLGQISFGVLAISWLVQAAIAVALFIFCARIYESLLMYKGGRIKFKQLLAMAKTAKGGTHI